MTSVGFSAQKLYGSVWQFSSREDDVQRSIQFHEPHPRVNVENECSLITRENYRESSLNIYHTALESLEHILMSCFSWWLVSSDGLTVLIVWCKSWWNWHVGSAEYSKEHRLPSIGGMIAVNWKEFLTFEGYVKFQLGVDHRKYP